MSLGAAHFDINSPTPNCCHDTQFLRNLVKRYIFGKAVKSINHSLLVCHARYYTASGHGVQGGCGGVEGDSKPQLLEPRVDLAKMEIQVAEAIQLGAGEMACDVRVGE
jgi:hypothetical protein